MAKLDISLEDAKKMVLPLLTECEGFVFISVRSGAGGTNMDMIYGDAPPELNKALILGSSDMLGIQLKSLYGTGVYDGHFPLLKPDEIVKSTPKPDYSPKVPKKTQKKAKGTGRGKRP